MGNFPVSECRGISLLDDARTPAIILTRDEKRHGARTFTLIHEYAHLLIRQAGISKHDHRSAVERYCNRFAAAFLLPTPLLDRVLGDLYITPHNWSLSQLDELSAKFGVTISAISLRLEDVGRAYQGFFVDVTSMIQIGTKKGKPKPARIKHQYIILSRLGYHYPRTVLGMVDSGTISNVEASRLLEASPVHFKAVRETLKKRGELVLDDVE
jgi:Zn-dependent peptidase ImmA (M78 family)